MISRWYIGIDNGVSGSIAVIGTEYTTVLPVPVKKEQSYTRKKQQITRIDWIELEVLLARWSNSAKNCGGECRVFIERPFVNPKGFKATVSALRALEATLITVEWALLSYQYIDSRQWQKEMLPKGLKGTAELKEASMEIGIRLFPLLKDQIKKQKDADGLLIAEWARRSGL